LNKSSLAPFDLYTYIMFPIGIPVGLLTGLTTHSLLESLVVGKPGVPWTHHSLPVLAGIVFAAAFYFGTCYHAIDEFLWLKRTNPVTGLDESFNAKSQLTSSDQTKFEHATLRRATMRILQALYNPKELFGDLVPTQPVTFDGKSVKAEQITEYAALVSAMDLLLRYKHLSTIVSLSGTASSKAQIQSQLQGNQSQRACCHAPLYLYLSLEHVVNVIFLLRAEYKSKSFRRWQLVGETVQRV
jgi:hypothetical protein